MTGPDNLPEIIEAPALPSLVGSAVEVEDVEQTTLPPDHREVTTTRLPGAVMFRRAPST